MTAARMRHRHGGTDPASLHAAATCLQPAGPPPAVAPVDEGLLLVCGVELCNEVLEVCNVLLAWAQLLLPLLPHVGVEHTTLCSTHMWELSLLCRVSAAIHPSPGVDGHRWHSWLVQLSGTVLWLAKTEAACWQSICSPSYAMLISWCCYWTAMRWLCSCLAAGMLISCGACRGTRGAVGRLLSHLVPVVSEDNAADKKKTQAAAVRMAVFLNDIQTFVTKNSAFRALIAAL